MGSSCYYIFKTSVNQRNQLVASITHLLEELHEYCLIGLDLVKFTHSPILHYVFSSWTENNDKNNTLPLGKQICIL